MGYQIKLLPIAYNDLRNAKKWYHEKREALASEFKAEVEKKLIIYAKILSTINENIKSCDSLWSLVFLTRFSI